MLEPGPLLCSWGPHPTRGRDSELDSARFPGSLSLGCPWGPTIWPHQAIWNKRPCGELTVDTTPALGGDFWKAKQPWATPRSHRSHWTGSLSPWPASPRGSTSSFRRRKGPRTSWRKPRRVSPLSGARALSQSGGRGSTELSGRSPVQTPSRGTLVRSSDTTWSRGPLSQTLTGHVQSDTMVYGSDGDMALSLVSATS